MPLLLTTLPVAFPGSMKAITDVGAAVVFPAVMGTVVEAPVYPGQCCRDDGRRPPEVAEYKRHQHR